MPSVLAEVILVKEGLGGPVQVGWGNVISGRPDLVAAAGNKAFLFYPSNAGYDLAEIIDAGATILSLAMGLREGDRDKIILGTEDRVMIYSKNGGSIVKLWETQPEPGALFVDVVLVRLNKGGGETIVAASETREALYFYQVTGQAAAGRRPELLAIRVLPGPAQKIAVILRGEGQVPLIAAAYAKNGSAGLLTLYYTEFGFAEGPSLESLPAPVKSLTSGDLRAAPGWELIWGGGDGLLRVVEADEELITALTSDNLGSSVPALATGKLIGEVSETLLAGTPEGFLFGYRAPVEKSSPDWAINTGSPVNDLAVSSEGFIGLGTADGSLQVWMVVSAGSLLHTVKAGENLESIAAVYQTTAAALARANNISNPGLIFPGQVLLIPRLP